VTALFAAEISKLRTVRVTWILTVFGVLFVALGASLILFGAFGEPFAGTAGEVADVVAAPGGNSIIVLVVALLSMTTEFRHGTIGRTLQLTPSRTAVLLAKMAAAAVYAVLFLALSLALVTVLLVVASVQQDIALDVGAPAYEAAWQGLVALVLTALLGVAFGALVRAQVVAVTVALVWVFAVEQLFVGLLPEVGRWLPFQALNSLFLSEAQTANAPPGTFIVHEPATALGVFLAWVVAFGLAAVVLMRRRDV
jgi:ABC-2 type transport system permease protein